MKTLQKLSRFGILLFLLIAPIHTKQEDKKTRFITEPKMANRMYEENKSEPGTSSDDSIIESGIKDLTKCLESAKNEQEKRKIQSLIRTANNLRNECQPQNQIARTKQYNGNATLKAITAYFIAQNYLLAEELFLHSIDSETIEYEKYIPVYGSKITGSPIIENFANSSMTEMIGEFETAENPTRLDYDLQYAIHGFKCKKQRIQ